MERIEVQDLTAELAAVMQLRWTQGYTVEQALCIARQKQESIQANYRLWAASPTNDRALREARENAQAIDYVVRVLESGVAMEEVWPVKPRCAFYKSIKRCFAIFTELGLPTDDEGMRAELARLLGRGINSRRELQAGDWVLAADRAQREAFAH